MSDHLKGLLVTTLGVLAVVPDSLFVRLIDADPMITAFWRGCLAGVFVLGVLMVFKGLSGFRSLRRSGWPGVTYTVLLSSTTPAFVLAVSNTSVANVVFILASMPIFAAIFSRIYLKESIELRMILTMLAVLVGLGVIAYGSGSNEHASWKGDIWAFYVAASFAAALTAARQAKPISMVPAIPIAYLGAALLMQFFVSPWQAFAMNWPLFMAHGACIAAGSCLLAIGPRYIRSAEVSLLVLLESILAPVLVWWVVGEDPGSLAIAGGAIVILALIASNAYMLAQQHQKNSQSV